jgi:hypothetical protein
LICLASVWRSPYSQSARGINPSGVNEGFMSTDYKAKIARDGRRHYSFTVTTPDRKITVQEGGFFKRDAAVAQAQAAIRDLKAFQEAK